MLVFFIFGGPILSYLRLSARGRYLPAIQNGRKRLKSSTLNNAPLDMFWGEPVVRFFLSPRPQRRGIATPKRGRRFSCLIESGWLGFVLSPLSRRNRNAAWMGYPNFSSIAGRRRRWRTGTDRHADAPIICSDHKHPAHPEWTWNSPRLPYCFPAYRYTRGHWPRWAE